MTDKAIWRILDAWRDDPKRVSYQAWLGTLTNGVVVDKWSQSYGCFDIDELLRLVVDPDIKFYIDGKEVTDEVEVEDEA